MAAATGAVARVGELLAGQDIDILSARCTEATIVAVQVDAVRRCGECEPEQSAARLGAHGDANAMANDIISLPKTQTRKASIQDGFIQVRTCVHVRVYHTHASDSYHVAPHVISRFPSRARSHVRLGA